MRASPADPEKEPASSESRQLSKVREDEDAQCRQMFIKHLPARRLLETAYIYANDETFEGR